MLSRPDHDGHAKMILEMAASTEEKSTTGVWDKIVIKTESKKKRNEADKIDQKSIEVQAQVADIKSQVQISVDKMVAIIEAKKQDIFSRRSFVMVIFKFFVQNCLKLKLSTSVVREMLMEHKEEDIK